MWPSQQQNKKDSDQKARKQWQPQGAGTDDNTEALEAKLKEAKSFVLIVIFISQVLQQMILYPCIHFEFIFNCCYNHLGNSRND